MRNSPLIESYYIIMYLQLPCVQNFCRWFWGHVFLPLIPKNAAEIKFLPLGNLAFGSFGNMTPRYALATQLFDESRSISFFHLLPTSCLTLSFSDSTSLCEPLNLEMGFGFVTIQKGSLNVSKRYASALPSNLSDKIF